LLDVKNGSTYSSSGTWLARVQQNTNGIGQNGLSVMNAWAASSSTIFEAAMGWNGSAAGYYPVFTVDGLGQVIFRPERTEAMRITNAGLVGIGTSSPAQKLHVAGGTTNFVRVDDTTNGVFNLLGSSAGNGLIGTYSLHPLLLVTNSLERARITSGGDLLVGTTSTTYAVAGNSFRWINGSTVMCSRNTTADTNQIAFFNPNGAVGAINTSGSATSYLTSSDYRLKNITGPITNSGAYIDSLNPVEGTWKADGSTFVGLIAHEVQEASRTPVASGTKDGEQMQGMDYSSAEIIANMLAELQSLRARVAALESN
jgi:hypothetical protein